ncbi:MAG: ABC transporter substrate-binding protein [Alphaproteobacteria bacterium]
MTKTKSDRGMGKLDLSRRHVLMLTGATAVMAPVFWKQAWAAEKKIFIRDPGGPYAPGFKEAFYEPFTKATGIEAIGLQGQHEPTSLIKAMVDTKTYTWDMALLTPAAVSQLRDTGSGYIEKHNVDSEFIRSTPSEYVTEYSIGNDVFATIMAYRTDAFEDKGRKAPGSWADFFDVENFPGRRAMRKHPFDTIEQALMADGVAPADLYPLDFDRAFKKLDTIKEHISVWWTGGAQTSQLIKSGEVDICPTWNARAQAAIDDGAPAKIVWDQHLWSSEGWAILKGTPKGDLCREFIKFAVDPERQAVFTKHLGYGPTHPDAYKYIPAERAAILPTSPQNMGSRQQADSAFWAKNKDRIAERFNAWVIT